MSGLWRVSGVFGSVTAVAEIGLCEINLSLCVTEKVAGKVQRGKMPKNIISESRANPDLYCLINHRSSDAGAPGTSSWEAIHQTL